MKPMLASSQTPLVLQHWRGELSLAVSFWLVGFLGNGVVLQVSRGIYQFLGGWPGLAIALMLFSLAGVCQAVGIWRSAGNSIKTHGKYLWPSLARFFVVVWLLGVIYVLYNPGLLAK